MTKQIYKSWIFWVEFVIFSVGVALTFLSARDTFSPAFSKGDLMTPGILTSIIALCFFLVSIKTTKYFETLIEALKKDLQVADGLYKKRNEYLTLGELNDIEQKFGDKGGVDIYIVSNDLSTETKDWKDIIEKNLLNNIKYFYLTNEKNKEHFNGILNDLNKKRKLKGKNLQDNFSISLNNCFFKFLPKFSEIVIYRDRNKAPIEMRCFVSYTNKGEKELYKEIEDDFRDTIWTLINDCINNTQNNNNCISCTHESRCKKYTPSE
jgi:hypothetical protein